MPIQLAPIAKTILKEGGKLFGARAQRVTTEEMNKIFDELEIILGKTFPRFKLTRALASKADHGDIDIIMSSGDIDVNSAGVGAALKEKLGKTVEDYSKNGFIHSVLYRSPSVNKSVHVDFICPPQDEYEAHFDYLSYNDFSGVLGVFARRIHFNYGTKGFYKSYRDTKGNLHYILITKNLRDGLKMMGYGKVIHKFDEIKNPDDVVEFISSTDLFDSEYLENDGQNVSDRKRLRPGRTLATEIKEKLIALNKRRTQPDEDHYLKTLFPQKYEEMLAKAKEIETKTVQKAVYSGAWLMANFPELKPGPVIGKIGKHLQQMFGEKLNDAPEETVKTAVADYLKVNPVG